MPFCLMRSIIPLKLSWLERIVGGACKLEVFDTFFFLPVKMPSSKNTIPAITKPMSSPFDWMTLEIPDASNSGNFSCENQLRIWSNRPDLFSDSGGVWATGTIAVGDGSNSADPDASVVVGLTLGEGESAGVTDGLPRPPFGWETVGAVRLTGSATEHDWLVGLVARRQLPL